MRGNVADAIKFILNDQVCEISNLPPNTTVLQYLRDHKNLTGTKEGCAEGDCGACTVVLSEKDQTGSIHYKAINACIMFIPVLDGKHLITVEHLKNKQGQLHTVQQKMVDHHGSQCGFCTPGFVMSLYALANNTNQACDEEIKTALAGNLCRCTGYRPILDAAKTFDDYKIIPPASLSKIQRQTDFFYDVDGFKYFAPRTIQNLCKLLAQYPDATILAGGTDIGLWVTKHHKKQQTMIYTGEIDSLKSITENNHGLEIGSSVTYSQCFASLSTYDETIETLLRRFASTQIRNSGTLGGNIANGSPIGDGPPLLIALNAHLILRSKKEMREIPVEDYFIAYGKQDLRTAEFLEKIIIPKKTKGQLVKTYKLSKRFDQDISSVCAAFSLTLSPQNKVSSLRIAYGGVAATPKRARHTEDFLIGQNWDEETLQKAMLIMAKDYTPLSDMRASSEYRMTSAQNLLYRFFIETSSPETQTQVFNYAP